MMDIELLERNRVRFGVLVGEVLDAVDIDKEENQILLTTRSGRKFLVYHEQDCCEKVQIVGQDGNFDNLIGKPLIEARDFAVDTGESESDYDSQTTTTLVFRVDDQTVVSRWVGDSNGYYSESVDIAELINGGE
jgi:serine/threonine protein phosphatase PrpC